MERAVIIRGHRCFLRLSIPEHRWNNIHQLSTLIFRERNLFSPLAFGPSLVAGAPREKVDDDAITKS
jgi:hypothetical protein